MARERNRVASVDGIGVRAVLGLLDRGRPEASCAAAIVLGELRPGDPRVRRALVRRLAEGPAHVRPYVREALARSNSGEALARLAADLLCSGVAREQAVRLLAARGERVLPHLDRLLDARPDQSCRAAFDVAVRIQTPAAIGWIVDHLRDPAPERARAIARAIGRDVVHGWPRPLRSALRKRLVAVLAEAKVGSAAAIGVAFDLLAAVAPARP